jgi:hypothetical protein
MLYNADVEYRGYFVKNKNRSINVVRRKRYSEIVHYMLFMGNFYDIRNMSKQKKKVQNSVSGIALTFYLQCFLSKTCEEVEFVMLTIVLKRFKS